MAWAIRERCYSPGLAPGRYARQDLSDEASDDAAVRARLRELASQRGPPFGYWRLGLVLGREGIKINKKKALPALRRGTAGVRRRGDRKRALSAPAPMVVPQGLDLRWSLDFVADTLAHGRRFRFLVLVDVLHAGAPRPGGRPLAHRPAGARPDCRSPRLSREDGQRQRHRTHLEPRSLLRPRLAGARMSKDKQGTIKNP